jgi:hypothetical protein
MITGMWSHLVSALSEPTMIRKSTSFDFLRVRNLPSLIRNPQSASIDPSFNALLYGRDTSSQF